LHSESVLTSQRRTEPLTLLLNRMGLRPAQR
jgi:hypothetical protein